MTAKEIYFDNNATTVIDEDVYKVMQPYLKECYANPSSIYSFSSNVKEKIKEARKNIANLIGALDSEIIFTSCASESNVTAIMSAVKNNPEKKHIITTSVEHASIMETMKYLESTGYNVTYLPVDKNGRLDIETLKDSITQDTFLIAIMMANNELGNIYPIKEIGAIAKENNILFHTDTVQAIGKLKIDVNDMNIDTMTIAGHKINAPKGVGVLYVRSTVKYTPLIFGHQENNRRGGTENVPYIIGLGEAAKKIIEDNYESNEKVKLLRDKLEREIINKIDDVVIYGDLENRLPNTTSIAFKNVKAEELLLVLESFNIYVSTGSACNSEIAEPSHVLIACKADLKNYSPIRISLSKYNTEEEVDEFIKKTIIAVNMIRRKCSD